MKQNARRSGGIGEKRREKRRTEPVLFSLKIGLYAGILWGAVRWLAIAMNFTKVPMAFMVDPWVKRSLLSFGYWQLTGYFLFIAMSAVAALAYLVLLGRLRGPVPGLLFGIGWWAVFYVGLGPLIGAVPPLRTLGWNSLITDCCLYAVWGLFIGYSIVFEFHDEARREPNRKPKPAGA